MGGKLVADCTILYIGCSTDSITEKWGETTVRPGRAKIQIDKVYIPSAHPPYSFVARSIDDNSWRKEDRTLSTLLGREILVETSDLVLHLALSPQDASVDDDQCSIIQRVEKNMMEPTDVQNHEYLVYDIEDDDVDENSFRSRKKRTSFIGFRIFQLERKNLHAQLFQGYSFMPFPYLMMTIIKELRHIWKQNSFSIDQIPITNIIL